MSLISYISDILNLQMLGEINKYINKKRRLMCFIVDFVLTPTQIYNDHYHNFNLLGECKTKMKQYDVNFYLLFISVYISNDKKPVSLNWIHCSLSCNHVTNILIKTQFWNTYMYITQNSNYTQKVHYEIEIKYIVWGDNINKIIIEMFPGFFFGVRLLKHLNTWYKE